MVVRPVRCNDPQNKRVSVVDFDVLCLAFIAYIMFTLV